MKQYRQGDLLIIACRNIPKKLRKRQGAVVATGEATGHSHRFDDSSSVALFDGPDGEVYARVESGASLTHEEHDAIKLVPGSYRIVRQREFLRESADSVRD